MKKFLLVTLCGVLGLSLTGCSSSKEVELDVNEVYDEILSDYAKDEVAMTQELDEEMLKNLYQLDDTLIEQYVATVPMMSANIDETIIVEAKEGKVEEVEDKILARQQQLLNSAFYPELVSLVEEYSISIQGNYIIFAVGNNAPAFVDAFNEYFK